MSATPISDLELANVVKTLPTSPRLLADLAPKLQQAEIDLADVTELLRRDAGLAARLIHVANSAFYARAEPATSIEEAVACLGFSEVYRIVGAVATSQLSDEPLETYGVDSHRFRENSLFVALVMEELAAATGSESRDAYTSGLMRSVGKVALDRHGRISGGVAPLPDGKPLLEWEQATWGSTNAEISARVLAMWRFPEDAVAGVRDHYSPTAETVMLGHLLNLAAGAADLRGFALKGEEGYWQFLPESFAATQVDEGKLVWAGERAFRTLQRITGALA